MSGIIADRLIKMREAQGFSQSELARRSGTGQSSINRLEAGETRAPRNITALAKVLCTSPEYLLGETDDPNPRADLRDRRLAFHGAPPDPSPDLVELNEFDVTFGLGGSFIHDVPVTGVRRYFSRDWIRQFTKSPLEYLFFATGTGDSMIPTVLDSDVVLIDSFDRTPRFADKLWAIEIGGLGAIKRLRPTKDGNGMVIISSNPEVPNDTAYDDEMRIVGRVAGVFRKM